MNQIQTRTIHGLEARATGDDKAIRFIATTEAPASVWDWERFDVVDEVLLIDGLRLPQNGQVPLLDSHSRWSIQDILGSARDFKQTETGGYKAIETEITFDTGKEGQAASVKVKAGHLTDMSVGYRVDKSFWIPENETQNINGKDYTGPLKVATAWTLKEVSLTPIGADALAKARSEYIRTQPAPHPATIPPKPQETQTMDPKPTENIITADDLSRAAETARAEALSQERTRVQAITDKCRSVNLPDMADALIARGATEAEATEELFLKLAQTQQPLSPDPVTISTDEADKFRSAATDGLLLRAGQRVENPAPGATELRGLDMAEIIRRCMVRAGIPQARDISGNRSKIASLAVRAGTMTTSDFSNIFSNVLNKSLLKAYEEHPATWREWVNVVSTSDFKTMYGISLSEAPGLELVKEGEEYQFKSLAEAQESYRPFKYGEILPLTWEMIVNDDLRAFARIPQLLGTATRRKESDLVYGLLLSNSGLGPTMADTETLFHADHNNLQTTGAAPSAATIDAGRQVMREQTGLKGVRLDIRPRFLLVSPKHEMTVDVMLNSPGSQTTDLNSGVINPMYRKFQSIVEARLLDANSGLGWYLIADPNTIDTFEVAYLDGYQAPQIETEAEFTRDVVSWKVRHVFGVGAMEYRSFYHNDGA